MSDSVELSDKLKEVVETVKALTVIELADLVKALEDELGVSAAAAAPVMVAGGAGGGGEAAAEEPTDFNVVLTDAGDKKINVIKVVRAITGLGLAEAKKFVEDAPSVHQRRRRKGRSRRAQEASRRVRRQGRNQACLVKRSGMIMGVDDGSPQSICSRAIIFSTLIDM